MTSDNISTMDIVMDEHWSPGIQGVEMDETWNVDTVEPDWTPEEAVEQGYRAVENRVKGANRTVSWCRNTYTGTTPRADGEPGNQMTFDFVTSVEERPRCVWTSWMEDWIETVSVTRISVEQVPDDTLVRIRLFTDHHGFSLRNSTVVRNVNDFYKLQSLLKQHSPWSSVPGLPLKPSLWVSSNAWRNEQLVTFLGLIVSNYQFLSSRALHLFLQSHHSMETIKQNIDGKRNDEVIVEKSKVLLQDTRTNSKEGFSALFGKN